MEEKIVIVLNEMAAYLSIAQMKKLQEVIVKAFAENEAVKNGVCTLMQNLSCICKIT